MRRVSDQLISVSKSESIKLTAEPFGARPVYALESVDEVFVATSQQQLRKVLARRQFVLGVWFRRLIIV